MRSGESVEEDNCSGEKETKLEDVNVYPDTIDEKQREGKKCNMLDEIISQSSVEKKNEECYFVNDK